jgi:hypothetical protein
MATQRLKGDHLLAASSSRALSHLKLGRFSGLSTCDQAIADQEPDTRTPQPPEVVVDLRLLGKGVRWAFGIEGATALCLYAVWLVWHFRQ